MYKQIIIARKDLNMSAGKLSAQVGHACMSFLTWMVRNNIEANLFTSDPNKAYHTSFDVDKNLYEQWINGEFTKVVLQAKNKNDLLKAVTLANNIGLQEKKDFFLIRDNCHTELTPEEDGRTLTCIGFVPLPAEVINVIGKKYNLYVG